MAGTPAGGTPGSSSVTFAVAVLTPTFIEATDLPNRQEVADDIRRASGLPTAGDKKAQEQQQEQAAQEAEKQRQMAEQAMAIELAGKAAEVEETRSKTALNEAKATLTDAQVVELGHTMQLDAQAANQPPEQPAVDPEAERERLINESLQEALAA